LEPSHVVAAVGVSEPYATGVLRFSLGRATTEAEVDRAASIVTAVLARMQSFEQPV
jgi:cysteine desulfurase